MVSSQELQTLKWVDWLIDISGLSATLDLTLSLISPLMKRINTTLSPITTQMERMGQEMLRVSEQFTDQQLQFLRSSNYTYLNGEQMRLIQNKGLASPLKPSQQQQNEESMME